MAAARRQTYLLSSPLSAPQPPSPIPRTVTFRWQRTGSTTLVAVSDSVAEHPEEPNHRSMAVRAGHPARPARTDVAAGRWAGLPPRGTDRPTHPRSPAPHRFPRPPPSEVFRFLPGPGTTSALPADPSPDPPPPTPGTFRFLPRHRSVPRPHRRRIRPPGQPATPSSVRPPGSGSRSLAGRRPSRPIRCRARHRSPARRRRTDRLARHRWSRCGTGSARLADGRPAPRRDRRMGRCRRPRRHCGPDGRRGARRAFGRRGGLGSRRHRGGGTARSGRGGQLADHCGFLFAVSSLPVVPASTPTMRPRAWQALNVNL